MLEVEKKYEDLFFKQDLIKQAEKLPLKIKKYLEKGKLINQDCEQNKITLNSKINDCINIEKIISNINEINNNIGKNNLSNIKISFIPEKDELNGFFGKIKEFGKLIDENLATKISPKKEEPKKEEKPLEDEEDDIGLDSLF